MNNRVVVAMGLALSGLGAQAQDVVIEVERARIAAARADHERVYASAEQACYQRFAVSDCLRRARAERRTVLSDLRRQELILNDLQRQAKAAAALGRIQ